MSRGRDDERPNHKNTSRTGRHMNKDSRDHRSRQLNPKDEKYAQSRQETNSSVNWRTMMSEEDARRIQSHADKTGTNQDFKSRSQRSASVNESRPSNGDGE